MPTDSERHAHHEARMRELLPDVPEATIKAAAIHCASWNSLDSTYGAFTWAGAKAPHAVMDAIRRYRDAERAAHEPG